MGYGIPAAVGAKAARPDATVVCVDGDGCFQMTCQELATAVLEELPIVVVIVNNGYLGMVRQWQDMFFDERFSQVHLTHHLPDYAALARRVRRDGFTVEDEDELDARRSREALACGPHRASSTAASTRAEHCFPMIPAGAAALDLVEYPAARGDGRPHETHTLAVLVENKPGALTRITSMFARRGFNIESLAVGPTERHDVSRITLRVDCDEHALEQIEKQMHKLVNVLRVTELAPGESLERELALIKVAAPPERRAELIALARGVRRARRRPRARRARLRDLSASPEEVDSFEELVRPHGIKELVRTGRVGLGRASQRLSQARPSSSCTDHRPKERTRMATIHREGEHELLNGKVAVIGYGSQGHAHALNLHDSGVEVVVGLREGSAVARRGRGRRACAVAHRSPRPCAARSSSRCSLPDHVQKGVWDAEVAPNLEPGAAVLFAHGLNIHFGRIAPPAGHDVIMVAPKAPGHRVRELFEVGAGTPGLVAVHQDASGPRAAARARVRRRRSAAAASACSRRRSRRRPRATSSASRPCSAAASPRSCRPASRRSSRRATSRRSPTTSASTS